MQKKELLKLFKMSNPKLSALSPQIEIIEITEIISSSGTVVSPASMFEINISHKFIFDNRLIPEEFNRYKVKNIITGKLPIEFSEPEIDTIPLFEYHNPEKYKSFVDNNMERIRKELRAPTMSKNEALDAITGDFKKHKNWVKKLKADFLRDYKWQDGAWQKLTRLEKLKALNKKLYKNKPNERMTVPFLRDNDCFGKMLPGVE